MTSVGSTQFTCVSLIFSGNFMLCYCHSSFRRSGSSQGDLVILQSVPVSTRSGGNHWFPYSHFTSVGLYNVCPSVSGFSHQCRVLKSIHILAHVRNSLFLLVFHSVGVPCLFTRSPLAGHLDYSHIPVVVSPLVGQSCTWSI